MPDLRTLDFRCAFIIEAADQPARFVNDVDLRTMLGAAQKAPNKAQRSRALRYRQNQEWPKTCQNSRGRGGIMKHTALAQAWTGELGEEHFYEPWHQYCRKCYDADREAQGDGRWEADEGAKPPPNWQIGEPYPADGARAGSRRGRGAAPAAAPAAQNEALAAAAHAYAVGLVRQTLAMDGDDVEPAGEEEPFDLHAFSPSAERMVFVRADAAGEPTAAEAEFASAHAGKCWVAVVENITVKQLSSGPMPLGGRVASLEPWA